MSQGLIFDIRRYSVHDGPGIRTTIFFKGCPLRCPWCHNPEGILPAAQPIVRERSVDGIKKLCQEIAGQLYTPDMVMEEIEKDLLFFEESEGGVTFSGGEPLMQAGFLAKVLKRCREAGIHTAVDTSAHADTDSFLLIASLADLLLFDVKSTDESLHMKYTGAGTGLIIQNLKRLSGHPVGLIIRIPVIPGFNDNLKQMAGICEVLSSSNIAVNYVELLPYHRLGRQKYLALGMPVPPPPKNNQHADSLASLKEVFLQGGFKVVSQN